MNEIEVSDPQPITPHNQALYEAGKQMLVDSVNVGRDFNNFMVGVATGAIPLYLALLAFALPKDYRPTWGWGVLYIIPGALFLAAALAFAVGVFPLSGRFSLDAIDQIEAARNRAIKWRGILSLVGFGLFSLAAAMSVVLVVVALRVKKPAEAPPQPTKVQLIK